jgi:hypothetical protein
LSDNRYDDLPEVFSPGVFAEKLGLARSTGYRIARQEGLVFQFGGRQVIFKSDFLALLEEKRAKPLTTKPTVGRHSEKSEPIARRSK